MKAILEFDLSNPEDVDNHKNAIKANDYASAFFEIHNEVFRPARKHGYGDPKIQKLLESNPNGEELVYELEKLFFEILEERNIIFD
jgi:hypothetical protein